MKYFSIFLHGAVLLLVSCKDESKSVAPVVTPPLNPSISSIQPASGFEGDIVSIKGSDFSNTIQGNVVYFNDKVATISAATTSELTVAVPTGLAAGQYNIKVTEGKQESNTLAFNVPAPLIDHVMPNKGLSGTVVNILGDNFSNSNSENVVHVNSTAAKILYSSRRSIIAQMPSGLNPGNVSIQVSTLGAPTNNTSFTIVTAKIYSPILAIGGSTASATFSTPSGVVVDKNGIAYVADRNNSNIKMADSTGTTSIYAGSGQGFADGTSFAAKFYFPSGIAFDLQGNLIVTDEANYRIRKIDSNVTVSTIAGSGMAGNTEGSALTATFGEPTGVVVDSHGDIFVADRGTSVIKKISDGKVTIYAGFLDSQGNTVSGYADGVRTAAKFNYPSGIAIDINDNLYIADQLNHMIRKIDPQGNVSTIAGTGVAGYQDGAASQSQFNYPTGIAVDLYGDIFVADFVNNSLRKIDPEGNVTTINQSFTLNYPIGVAIDSKFNLYVTDAHRLVKLQAN